MAFKFKRKDNLPCQGSPVLPTQYTLSTHPAASGWVLTPALELIPILQMSKPRQEKSILPNEKGEKPAQVFDRRRPVAVGP